MAIDPIIFFAIQFAIAAIFIVGGIEKFSNLDKFEMVLHGYRVLPGSLVRLFAVGLPITELLIGLALGSSTALSLATYGAISFLILVTAAVVINLVRGNVDINCGCGGLSDNAKISWAIPARNSLLILAASLLLMSKSLREFILFDAFITGFFILTLLGLYVATNQLISNSPLLKALRRAK